MLFPPSEGLDGPNYYRITSKMRFSVIFGAENKWGHPVKKVGSGKYGEKSGRLVDLDPPLVDGHPSFLLKIKILNCYW